MRENTDQKNSEYGHFLRSVNTVMIELNNLDANIQNSAFSNFIFKVTPKFIVLESNQGFDIHNTEGLKFLERIRLGLSDLVDQTFMRKSQYCVIPITSCS